jgi:hypothetical protein
MRNLQRLFRRYPAYHGIGHAGMRQYRLAHRTEEHSGEPAVPVRPDHQQRAGGLLDERLHRAANNGSRDRVVVGLLLGPASEAFGQDQGSGPAIFGGFVLIDGPCLGKGGEGVDGGQAAHAPRCLVKRETDRRNRYFGSVDADDDRPVLGPIVGSPSTEARATMTGHGACAVTWVATDPSAARDVSKRCPEPRTSTRASGAALTSCSTTGPRRTCASTSRERQRPHQGLVDGPFDGDVVGHCPVHCCQNCRSHDAHVKTPHRRARIRQNLGFYHLERALQSIVVIQVLGEGRTPTP